MDVRFIIFNLKFFFFFYYFFYSFLKYKSKSRLVCVLDGFIGGWGGVWGGGGGGGGVGYCSTILSMGTHIVIFYIVHTEF